jgi:hypothetical protein
VAAQPVVRCGVPLSTHRFPSFFALQSSTVDGGITIPVWGEYRDGDRRGEVFCSMLDCAGRVIGGLPFNGLMLPRHHGVILSTSIEQVALNVVAVGIVTVSDSGTSCASFALLRADFGRDTTLSVVCDSSLVGRRFLGLTKLIASDDHSFLAVFADRSGGAPLTFVRRIAFDPATPSMTSPEYRPIAESATCVPLDATVDGGGGCFILGIIVSTGTTITGPDGDFRLFHMQNSGLVDYRWPRGGRPVARDLFGGLPPAMSADGRGGLYVAWPRQRTESPDTIRAVAVRLNPSGELVRGWDPTGTALLPRVPAPQVEVSLATGREGRLFALVRGVTSMYVAALDGSAGPAPGWSGLGVALVPPKFGANAVGGVLAPAGDDACVVSWSLSDNADTRGYDLFAAVLPLPVGRSLALPPDRVPVCTTDADQAVGAVVVGASRRPLVLWTETLDLGPFDGGDGLYVGPADLGGLVRGLPPELSLISRRRAQGRIVALWRSERIVRELPQVLVGVDGSAPEPSGPTSRVDSWTVQASVALGPACSNVRIELAVPGAGETWTRVAVPLDVACAPAHPLRIIAAKRVAGGDIEVRISSEGVTGLTTVALYDVAGRRLVSSTSTITADGEHLSRLPAPRSQGVYWIQARNGSLRSSRSIVLGT